MMKKRRPTKTVLLIENNLDGSGSVLDMFNHQGSYSFELTYVVCLDDAVQRLAMHPFDVILLDLALPDTSGRDAILQLRAYAPRTSIVLLCDPDDEPFAIQAMETEVQDYLIKGEIEAHELMRALRNAVARRALEDVLYMEQDRAQVTLDSIADAVICTDIQGNISYLNPVAERMTGRSLEEAVGRPLMDVFRIMDATTGEAAANPLVKAIGKNRPARLPVNCILTRPDGHEIFIEDSIAPIRDRDGFSAGSVLVFRDVTVARALAAHISHLAEHDPLTGLPNRLLLRDRLGQAIMRANPDTDRIALLFLDLDGFKHINDSLGHAVGDKLLQSVAKRLRDCIRTPDTVSRQGGDEFVVLLQDVREPEDAAVAAIRILKAVAEVHSIDHHDLCVKASIGVSLYPEDGLDAETLIKNADTAMYQAKEHERHSYRFFKAAMNVRAVQRQSIEQDLRRALERHEFTLHYQPKSNLKTGKITGAEALLRWTHPKRGLTPPLQFIPIAEVTGLILPIGSWVLHEACKQARAWIDAGMHLATMAVNVSALQFRKEGFLEDLTAILDETGLDPHVLELEVTESVLMVRIDHVTSILGTLRERGVRVSVDDFGTGYSNLSFIRKLPLDSLKIDQTFVRQITSIPRDTSIVNAIIGMGRSLKLQVIAEGVETKEELDFLKLQECDEAQGFYFSQPVPANQFANLLVSHPLDPSGLLSSI
ncbi:MAG: putative bifunctional diguanylate cyclase/phosphodiesterase [Acidobacteriaceae bacterium]